MKYKVSIEFDSQVERTERVLEVAEAFGLGLDEKKFVIYKDLEVEVNPRDVVYITGQSGSGKSLLLKELEKQMKAQGIKTALIDDVVLEDKPLVDQIGTDTEDALRILSLAGLNDAYLFIRSPKELSDGQRYRLRLAKLIENPADVWVADEFGAVLDRVTAKIIAFSMQKVARKYGKTLIVATTHEDLDEELGANLRVRKRFREKVEVKKNAA